MQINSSSAGNNGNKETACPGCCAPTTQKVESVSANKIANAWVDSQTHGADADSVRVFVLSDLGSDQVEFWLCDACGLEFAHPMKSWSHEHYPGEKHSLGFDHELALAELAGMSPLRLLEIGCADGQFLEKAAALGHEVVGIDFSQEDVLAARARGVEAYAGDIDALEKMVSGKFDLVALFQVIEHLREPGKVFENIRRIVKPGAIVMVGCPSHRRYSRIYSHPERIDRSDFWDYPPQHLLRWTPNSLVSFLKRFNFETEKIAFEPLSTMGAMAHLTALQGMRSDWYDKSWRRKFASLMWLGRLIEDKLVGKSSGIRLFVRARLQP